MRGKDSQSNIVIIAVAIVLISSVCFGVYKLTSLNVFDTSGSYIRDMASDNDVLRFMDRAESVSYYDVMNSDIGDFDETAFKYWGYIEDKEIFTDGSVEYNMTLILNKSDSSKFGNKYFKDSSGLCHAPITFKTSEAYNNFNKGDDVWMYGTLIELRESDKYGKIPHFEAKKVILDIPEE